VCLRGVGWGLQGLIKCQFVSRCQWQRPHRRHWPQSYPQRPPAPPAHLWCLTPQPTHQAGMQGGCRCCTVMAGCCGVEAAQLCVFRCGAPAAPACWHQHPQYAPSPPHPQTHPQTHPPQIKDEYAMVQHLAAPAAGVGPTPAAAAGASGLPAAVRAAAAAAAAAEVEVPGVESRTATAKLIESIPVKDRCVAVRCAVLCAVPCCALCRAVRCAVLCAVPRCALCRAVRCAALCAVPRCALCAVRCALCAVPCCVLQANRLIHQHSSSVNACVISTLPSRPPPTSSHHPRHDTPPGAKPPQRPAAAARTRRARSSPMRPAPPPAPPAAPRRSAP